MPPLPRLRVGVLAALAEQLKFTPREIARRQLENAEGLLTTIDPAGTYPEDWLVSRITGYRPDLPEPALLIGEALRRDLGALVERLSIRADYDTTELPAWLTVEDLCRRWSVTRRTLERYRDLGLQGRRARHPRAPLGDGKQVLLFDPGVVEWFEQHHADRLTGAAGFTRIDARLARTLIRRAARYRRRLGWNRGRVARRLSARFGRSVDAIRRLLIRHDDLHAAEAPPIFPEPGPATERQARLIERALRFRGYGISPRLLSRRLRKSPATIHRVACERRAAMLSSLRIDAPHHEPRGDATQTTAARAARAAPPDRTLASDAVRLGLGLPGTTSVPDFIARALADGWPDAAAERDRALALITLRRRAARAIAALPTLSPSALQIDEICTDLRWITRLKVEQVRGQGMLLLKTVETRLGRPLGDLPPGPAARLLDALLDALLDEGGPIDRFDPSRGGRLAAPAGIALNKAIAHWTGLEGSSWANLSSNSPAPQSPPPPPPPPPAGQAPALRATRIAPTSPTAMRDWTLRATPWQSWTDPPAALREALAQADEDSRLLLAKRFGLLISPPLSLRHLAAELGARPEQIRQRERQAMRALLAPASATPRHKGSARTRAASKTRTRRPPPPPQ